MTQREELIDKVLEEIVRDVYAGDLTAIEELLRTAHNDDLLAYLPADE
jgi:hypothetical protein